MTAAELLKDRRVQASLRRLEDERRREIPGMVELSTEAHEAGVAPGLTRWRATFEFGVTAVVMARDVEHADELTGGVALLLEELEWKDPYPPGCDYLAMGLDDCGL